MAEWRFADVGAVQYRECAHGVGGRSTIVAAPPEGSAAVPDGGRTVANWVWNASVSGLSRFKVAATTAPPRGLAAYRLPVMAWVRRGWGLISTNLVWFSAADATA